MVRLKWRTVPRLINRQLSAVWQADRGEQPPARIGYATGHPDSFGHSASVEWIVVKGDLRGLNPNG